MEDFEIWVYRIIIVALGSVLLWAIRKGADKVEKLIDAINKLESQFSLQNKDMNYFHVNCNKREKEVNKILEDHEKRIRSVEN